MRLYRAAIGTRAFVHKLGEVVLTAIALCRVTVPAKTKTAIRRQDQVVLAVPIGRQQGIGYFVV